MRVERHEGSGSNDKLSSAEGVYELAEKFLATARYLFERDGRVDVASFLVITRNPDTGAALDPPEMMMIANADASKDQFAAALRELVDRLKAVAFLFVSETWYLTSPSREEVEKARAKYGSLEHAPGRKEGVLVTLEHIRRPGTTTWMAEIVENADGRRVLAPFEKTDGTASGRFAGLLQSIC